MTIENKTTKHTYFPNLDGLRFIGSLIIIILHIEDIKIKHFIFDNSVLINYLPIGNLDVSLFFVLSGFLITYLLLKEKKDNGFINLKNYYARRTLRIWPLHHFILILGFFVLPYLDRYFTASYSANIYHNFWLYFIGCFLFLSPFIRSMRGLPQTIGPIWSVAVEELFYLCWPLFLKNTKKYLFLFIFITLLILFIRNGFFLGASIFHLKGYSYFLFDYIRGILIEYRISCMAIGGIGAYWVVFEKNKILSFIYRKDVQWAIYILTTILLFFKIGAKSISNEKFPSVFYEIYSVLFIVIIVNLATNPKSILKLDYKWMTYLGKISYGLYMYHSIMRVLSLELTEYLFKNSEWDWQMNVCLYTFTLSFTILISILSYEYLEKRFLNLKKKFTT